MEKRVAIAPWQLETNVEYQKLSHLFGVGVFTACNIVHEVCTALVDSLLHRYVKTPMGAKAADIIASFEEKC